MENTLITLLIVELLLLIVLIATTIIFLAQDPIDLENSYLPTVLLWLVCAFILIGLITLSLWLGYEATH